MLLNAPAVHDDVRHQGLGTRPLLWAQSRAQLLGLARLGLHVLADNMLARHFYRTHGVIERGVAEVPSHPRLRHSGGSILMSRAVCAEGAAKRSLMKCREKSDPSTLESPVSTHVSHWPEWKVVAMSPYCRLIGSTGSLKARHLLPRTASVSVTARRDRLTGVIAPPLLIKVNGGAPIGHIFRRYRANTRRLFDAP